MSNFITSKSPVKTGPSKFAQSDDGSSVVITDPGTLGVSAAHGRLEDTWVQMGLDKVSVVITSGKHSGTTWTGPERHVVFAATAPARKFTDADIGKRVKVNARGGHAGGPAKGGTVIGVFPKQMWPVVVDVDGEGRIGYMHREVMFEREVEVAVGTGIAGTCDECGGTGFVELFMGPSPCSLGCKP